MRLLDTQREPVCSETSGASCTCMLMSNDGSHGMMNRMTSVGSIATVFIPHTNYCYDGDIHNLVRECGDNEEWSGEVVDQDDIAEGLSC